MVPTRLWADSLASFRDRPIPPSISWRCISVVWASRRLAMPCLVAYWPIRWAALQRYSSAICSSDKNSYFELLIKRLDVLLKTLRRFGSNVKAFYFFALAHAYRVEKRKNKSKDKGAALSFTYKDGKKNLQPEIQSLNPYIHSFNELIRRRSRIRHISTPKKRNANPSRRTSWRWLKKKSVVYSSTTGIVTLKYGLSVCCEWAISTICFTMSGYWSARSLSSCTSVLRSYK